MPNTIDTKTVQGRRDLRFETLDDIAADVEKLAAAREIKTVGNWSAGQIFKHLAIVMNGAIDGIPSAMPWYARVMLFFMRPFFRGMLNGRMPAGYALPPEAAKHLIPPDTTSTAEGLTAIREGLRRLKSTDHREPSPFMGKLSLEDANKLQCRHCELHLSFLSPVN